MKNYFLKNEIIEKARDVFGVNHWGNNYFEISEEGDVVVKNFTGESNVQTVSLMDVIAGMNDRELQMPVLLRIENIIEKGVNDINQAFANAIYKEGYSGKYQGVFPVKVNHQAQVVEDVAKFGKPYKHGFEVGSKAEMIAVLSTLEDYDSLIICNGYKDQEFIDLGLQAVKLGFRCFFVIETLTELPIIIERSDALGVRPYIGVRVKMISEIGGHWSRTSGERSVFGLSPIELTYVIDSLKSCNMLDCLQLLHCHLSSQISNIRDIRGGVVEACRYYASLCREGADMSYIDLGGGLAVDYMGAHSQDSQSRNYSLTEYCEDIVDAIKSTLSESDCVLPTIITESGRATVAYSSILLFNILDVTRFAPSDRVDNTGSEHYLIKNMQEILTYLKEDSLQECYNDAHFYRDEVRALFKRGSIDLRARSTSENSFLEILYRINKTLSEMKKIPAELEHLSESLADIYYGNFSLFRSLPDSWAIDQLFPVMPVHRLDEELTRLGVLADITCDCDGKIDKFSVDQEYKNSLPLHPLKENEEYYLGVFLVGAYQETLGDLHNLFGDTNVVTIRLNKDSSFDFVQETHGDTVADVLSYVEFDPKDMQLRFRNKVEAAVKAGRISAKERQLILKSYNASMQGYTYYEKDTGFYELQKNVEKKQMASSL